MTNILILHVEAGLGHRKVAEAIAEELRARNKPGVPPNVSVEVMDALEKTPASFRNFYPKLYFQLVTRAPWIWGFFFFFTNLPWVYFLIAPLRSLWNQIQSRELEAYLGKRRFDFILFTHFFPAQVCGRIKKKGHTNATLITVVTDVIPHAVWQNPGSDFYWVMANESKQVLLKRGVREEQIYPEGIPVASIFSKQEDDEALREKFGLEKERFTLLFTGGSFGIGPTKAILESLNTPNVNQKIQAIVVCGNNQKLFETLNKRRFRFPIFLFGFINNMHEIMSCSDLILAKSGGATMCESLNKNIPMVIMEPIPGQESYNAKWLVNHGAAFQIRSVGEIKELLLQILENRHMLKNTHLAITKISKPNAVSDIANFILLKAKYRKEQRL